MFDAIVGDLLLEMKTGIVSRFTSGQAQMRSHLAKRFSGRLVDRLIVDDLIPRSSLGGYNRHRAVTAAASKRAAVKRRNIAKRSPH